MRFISHRFLLTIHDLLVVIVSAFLSYFAVSFFSEGVNINHLIYCIAGVSLSTILILIFHNNFYKYQFVLNPAKHTIGLLKFLFAGLFALILASFIFKLSIIAINRVLIGKIYIILFLIFFISRIYIVPIFYYWLVKKKYVSRNLIIIGTGSLSIEKVKFLKQNKKSYYNIVGFLDNNDDIQGKTIEGYPVLGYTKDLAAIARTYEAKDVLISLENMSNWKLQSIINFCKRAGKTIHVVSELYDIVTEKMEIDEIGGISSFRVKQSNYAVYETIKRIYDILFALIVIFGLSPLWLFIVLLIKLTSKGPVFYNARVIGMRQKEFTMYKFRSMYFQSNTDVHANKVTEMIINNQPTEKLKQDSRITPIGKILRKLSIDEFPQFLNVLKGNMSIVGPRPCLPYEYEVMDKWHRTRFAIKPGITGLWQIKGRNEVKFNDQIALDLYYIEHRSLRLDFEILLKTIPVIIFGKGGL